MLYGRSSGDPRSTISSASSPAIPFLVGCRPAFEYGTRQATLERAGDGWRWTAGNAALDLATPLDLRRDGGALRATFTLHAGDEIPLVLRHAHRDDAPPRVSLEACLDEFRKTVRFWQSWIGRTHYQGRWREMVKRSCLALKLLTFAPTGAQAYGGNLSEENVDMLDVDAIIWLDALGVPDLGGPLYASLPVHTEGREVYLDSFNDPLGAATSFVTVLSLPFLLEGLVPRLALAVDGDPATVVPVTSPAPEGSPAP